MQIPQTFPQFQGKRILIFNGGRRAGKIYVIVGGTIEEYKSLRVEVPTYSDNEGFFARRGNGTAERSGSVREIDDNSLAKKFVQDTVDSLEEARYAYKPRQLYIFSKRFHQIENALPVSLRTIPHETYPALDAHILYTDMLKKINALLTRRRVVPVSYEAKKILRK